MTLSALRIGDGLAAMLVLWWSISIVIGNGLKSGRDTLLRLVSLEETGSIQL